MADVPLRCMPKTITGFMEEKLSGLAHEMNQKPHEIKVTVELRFHPSMPIPTVMHVSSHHPALSTPVPPQPVPLKRNANRQETTQTTAAQVKGLYAFTRKNSEKDSDSTEDDTGSQNPELAPGEADTTPAKTEADTTAKSTLANAATANLGLTYTARGTMSAAPSAGGVFQTIV